MYNVQLGRIGCDDSCLACNGTTQYDCLICKNTSKFLYLGMCYDYCPSEAPVYSIETESY